VIFQGLVWCFVLWGFLCFFVFLFVLVFFLHTLSKLVPHHVFFLDSAAMKTSMISNGLLPNSLQKREGYSFLFFFSSDVVL